jgi:acyl dehydratase
MAVDRFPVEAGHILMFARSVGDPNPVYADANSPAAKEAGGILAPPTFVQASAQFDDSYPLRPVREAVVRLGQGTDRVKRESSGGSGGGGSGTGLHAEQHYEYHRPLRAGDVLTAETRDGKRWQKEGKRAGKLVFSEMITEYRDQQGDLVVTARTVGVRTEKVVGS